MKHRSVFFALFAVSMLATLGQSQESPVESPSRIDVARCAYAPSDESCLALSDQTQDTPGHETLAQLPRRMPSPRAGRPMPYPSAPYPTRWMGRPSGAHVLIGALIGFGFGAAIAAKGRANAGGILGLGAIGGGIGAGLGASIPAFPTYHDRGPWDDDDEEAHSKPPHIRPHRQDKVAAAADSPTAQPKSASTAGGSQKP